MPADVFLRGETNLIERDRTKEFHHIPVLAKPQSHRQNKNQVVSDTHLVSQLFYFRYFDGGHVMELSIEQALQQGIAVHKEGKLQEAERLYGAILQSQPRHPHANHNLGVLAVSVDKTDEALAFFKTALEASPETEQFWLSYIDALIKEKQFENAKKILEQGKKQGVAGEKLNTLEAQLSSEVKAANVSSARPLQEQLSKLSEDYQNRKFNDAEKLAISITEQFPKDQFAWKVLGAVLREKGRVKESLLANRKAVDLSPQDNEAHYNVGLTLQDMGRLEEAEASYRQALVLKPDFGEAHSRLGITLYELGRLEEAEASYRQAIVLKPDFAEAHSNLGLTLLDLGRLEEAEASCRQAIVLKPDFGEAHGNLGFTLNAMGLKESALQHFERKLYIERGPNPSDPNHKSFKLISKDKIDHDIEQFEYLAATGCEIERFDELATLYKKVSSEINWTSATEGSYLSDKHKKLLEDTYNRPIQILEAPALAESAVNDSLDANKITDDYFEHEFGLTYFDEFLSPAALKSLRSFLLESTIWFDFFHTGGYMGAYLNDGMGSALILQIAEDIRKKLPKIFRDHHLTQLWAFKYDNRAYSKNNASAGINVHADFAAINVNFWITPNSANLDPSSGGLVVYNTEAPVEWDYKTYNKNEEKIRNEILKGGQKKTVVPYNENRVLIFNSSLFHETDKIQFKEGYENRRINITMLFGKREL